MQGSRVDLCIVVPPVSGVQTPPLGPPVLAAACRARGISTRVINGNLVMAERIGQAEYHEFTRAGVTWMVSERVFRELAWPADVLATMDEPLPFREREQTLYDSVVPHVGAVIEDVVEQIVAREPRIVGITTVFQQNLAALAVARRVRERLPDACIVMGGGNVMAPMGAALAEVAPWVDHFFSGEADVAFPDFCEALLGEGRRPAERVVMCKPIWDMRQSPLPDYSDYFEDLRAAQARGTLGDDLPLELLIEFGRGCWWGAKNHCTFCGLNGDTIAFREKPAELALSEIDALEAQWGIGNYWVADNILAVSYFKNFLPVLAEREEKPELFFEVKSNLTEEQIALLARAGVRAMQPGIESFSSHVLKLMRKGVSGARNIATMRTGLSYGIRVGWLYLYGFPGERVEDYAPLLDLIPAIEHLYPPETFLRIMIDRFSPNFDRAEEMGIGALTPMPGYVGLYPRDARLHDIAYHFRGTYDTAFTLEPALIKRLDALIERWQGLWEPGQTPPMLRAVFAQPSGVVVSDTRSVARAPITLLAHDVFALLCRLERPTPRTALDPAAQAIADDLIARGFVIEHEEMLLSIVIRSPSVTARTDSEATLAAAE